MFFGITLTANHFIFDAFAGLIVALAGVFAALGIERLSPRFWLRLAPPFLRPAPVCLRERD